MSLSERYAACGATARLRGDVRGDAFVLRRAEGAPYEAWFFGAFGLCQVCPVAALIGVAFALILRSARRKKG